MGTLNIQPTFEPVHPFLHADQAQAGPLALALGIETLAIILRRQLNPAVEVVPDNLATTRVRMANHVLECLLSHTEQTKGRFAENVIRNGVNRHLRLVGDSPRQAFALGPHRLRQPNVGQDVGRKEGSR
jgi:hypothetical protein